MHGRPEKLTSRRRVLLEKLIVVQLVHKLRAFYRARHWNLSWGTSRHKIRRPSPRFCAAFGNMFFLYGEGVLAPPPPSHKLEEHPWKLSSNLTHSQLPSFRNLRTCHAVVTISIFGDTGWNYVCYYAVQYLYCWLASSVMYLYYY